MTILPTLRIVLAFICVAEATSCIAQTSTLVTGSPSFSNTSGSKQQQSYAGTLLASHVASTKYCDANTSQFGGYGTVTDNITNAAATPTTPASTTYVITDEAEAEYLHGAFGNAAGLTRQFLSGTAHYYTNNSIGIGGQESLTATWQYYLRPCVTKPGTPPNNFFSSISLGAGGLSQRLYYTPGILYSAILPISAQASYVFPSHDPKVAPHAIVSAQLTYTPVLNAPHDYQIYENADVLFPTAWNALTISITQSDYYVNNAPAPDKRNYHAEGIQLNFTFSSPPAPTPPATPTIGACYTADKSSHLYCYNAQAQNACVAPGVFRPNAVCSVSAAPAIR